MRSIGNSKTASAEIEAELLTLGKRRLDVERRRDETITALKEAKSRRSEALAVAGADVDEISGQIRSHTTVLADFDELLGDIRDRSEEASQRLSDAKAEEGRTDEAERLERIAIAIEARIEGLATAVSALGSAARAMIDEIPENVGLFGTANSRPPSGRLDAPEAFGTRREAVAGIVAECIASVLPDLFDTSDDQHGYRTALHRIVDPNAGQIDWCANNLPGKPLGPSEIVEALISSRLRDRARGIATGELPMGEGQLSVREDPVAPFRVIPEVHLFVLRPFSFVANELGLLHYTSANWTNRVPEPVATVAISQGLALRLDSPQGAEAFEREKERQRQPLASRVHTAVRAADAVKLGDVMKLRRPAATAA